MTGFSSARAFLNEVLRRYRGLASYSDTGWVQPTLGRREPSLRFETDFRQPADFRFCMERPHPHRPLRHLVTQTLVGRQGAHAYFLMRTPQGPVLQERPADLGLAVAGATGVSLGSAHTIASLLLAEIEGLSLPQLQRLRLRRPRIVDGVRCVAVSGRRPRAGGRLTAWFGAEDLLLRRLLDHRGRSEERRTAIRTGHTIPAERMEPPPARGATDDRP